MVLVLSACVKESGEGPTSQIVFLGHIYQHDKENQIDHRLSEVNFRNFGILLLGGDLCVETTKEMETLNYLDGLFDLGSSNTHWSLGNHDVRNGNLAWISEKTKRDSYYYQDMHGLRILVINTTLQDCDEMMDQFNLMVAALTPATSFEQILIVSHHAIWTKHLEDGGIISGANAKHSIWRAFCPFAEESTFAASILPLLQGLTKEGKSVMWLAGDYGQKVSAFHHRSNEGIVYVGSGIAESGRLKSDSILSMAWQPDGADLNWTFTPTEVFAKENK